MTHYSIQKLTNISPVRPSKEQETYERIILSWAQFVYGTVHDCPCPEALRSPSDFAPVATGHAIRDAVAAVEARVSDELRPYVHIGCTSEDVMMLADAMYLQDMLVEVMHSLFRLIDVVRVHTNVHKPLMSRTHGQPATPRHWSAPFLAAADRLQNIYDAVDSDGESRWGGATGGFVALRSAYKAGNIDWESKAAGWMSARFGVIMEPDSGKQVGRNQWRHSQWQILIQLCDAIEALALDCWHLVARPVAHISDPLSSSAMPHKQNPVMFERAEGLARLARPMLTEMARSEWVTREGRDLSGLFIRREMSSVLMYVDAAVNSLERGVDNLRFDQNEAEREMMRHPECWSEVMVVRRKMNEEDDAYATVKEAFRG